MTRSITNDDLGTGTRERLDVAAVAGAGIEHSAAGTDARDDMVEKLGQEADGTAAPHWL